MIVVILVALAGFFDVFFSGYRFRSPEKKYLNAFTFLAVGIIMLLSAGNMLYVTGRGKLVEVSALPDNLALRLKAESTTSSGVAFFVIGASNGDVYCVKKTNDLPPGTDYLGRSYIKDAKGVKWTLTPWK